MLDLNNTKKIENKALIVKNTTRQKYWQVVNFIFTKKGHCEYLCDIVKGAKFLYLLYK